MAVDRRGRSGATRRGRKGGATAPLTRAERRRRLHRRRARLAVVGTMAVCALVLVSWFPASALVSQRRAVNDTAGQLHRLQAQDRALGAEQRRLSDPNEVERIAREKYQLVSPGQQIYTVLPPNGAAGGAGEYAGDPGFQKPVSPNASSDLPPGEDPGSSGTAGGTSATTAPGATRSASASSTAASSTVASSTTASGPGSAPASTATKGSRPTGAGSSGGLFDRIEQTLEFWR